jgi:hypothetical protein
VIKISTNIGQVLKKLDRMDRQVPFALSKAINKSAVDVQRAEGVNLGRKQIIRTDWWKGGRKFGINIKPFATKNKPTAVIGTQADWERLHERGGTKTPKQGKNLAIPTAAHRGGARNKITRAKRPRALLDKPRHFFAQVGGMIGIWKRTGRKRLPIKLLFTLTRKARLDPKLGYEEVGEAVANKTLPEHFAEEFRKAIK